MTFTEILYITFWQYIILNLSYYIPSLILFLIDYNLWFVQYKIQDKIINMVQLYKKVIPQVMFNTLVLPIPFMLILANFINVMNYKFSVAKLVFDLTTTPLLVEMLFYTAHRIFHTKLFYKYHKKHHEINVPIGVSALYMTPIDAIFGNLLPSYLPLLMISAHPVSVCCWIGLGSFNTVLMAHSGFKWLADFHDYHHANPKKNYGTNLYMDKLFRTCQKVD